MRRPLATLLILVALIGGACQRTQEPKREPAAKPDLNATVRIAAAEDQWPGPESGPGVKSDHFAYPLNMNVHDTLIILASDYSLKPGLAESWELIEPSTWRFHLRKGVKFHNGQPFTADDVVWTWGERMAQGQTVDTISSTLGYGDKPPRPWQEAVKKIDEYTVDFIPKSPNLRLPEQIVHPEGSIVPKGMHLEQGVGAGPFKLVEYKAKESGVFERYDDYWGPKAKVKRIEVRFLPDPQTRIEALKAGQVDLILDVPQDAVSTLEDRFRIVRSKPGRNQLIYIKRNPRPDSPFNLGADKTVRQAVALALDNNTYVDTALEGEAEPGRWMAPASVLGKSAELVKAPKRNLTRAREVLEAAGWKAGGDGIRVKDGRRLSLTIIGWAEIADASFQVIQAQLKEAGIEVTIKKSADQAAYSAYRTATEFDLNLEFPNQNDGNPAFLPVLRFYSKNATAAPYAPAGEFDTWAEKALAAKTRDEVQKASAEMMRILEEQEFIVVPVAGVYRIYAMTKDVNLEDSHPSQSNQRWVTLSKITSS
ncbi:MAG: ABC transporter substrate-binding protein [Actinomycetota bacterium]